MGGSSRDAREERRAAVAALQARQRRAERRRAWLVWGTVAAVVLALAVPVTLVLVDRARDKADATVAAEQPIAGERDVKVPSARHVSGDVDYSAEELSPSAGPSASARSVGASLPPVGGDHDPTPQNCGFYDQPVRNENAVHSLEHGAVWLAYRTDLDATDVARIREIATTTPYVLASPYGDLAAPVVATAWGVQLELDTTSDPRLDAFLQRYVQGEQTPEPGAPCSGGVGTPLG